MSPYLKMKKVVKKKSKKKAVRVGKYVFPTQAIAKEMPIHKNAETLGRLEAQIKSHNSRIYTLEKKVFKIK